MVSMVLVRTSIKTGNPLFFKMCQIKSELLQLIILQLVLGRRDIADRLQ